MNWAAHAMTRIAAVDRGERDDTDEASAAGPGIGFVGGDWAAAVRMAEASSRRMAAPESRGALKM
ncbi:hypothetical protein GCM10010219_19510 [Streptomyces netropsis]|nr:hypothetical protein GCM10010219_19510 [Streptomyces netropsis]